MRQTSSRKERVENKLHDSSTPAATGELRGNRGDNMIMWRIQKRGSFTSHTKGVSPNVVLLTNSVNVHGFLQQGPRVQWSGLPKKNTFKDA